ncbi:MAG: Fic family protein [Sulfurimonas sp.]|nr:Fic family protein [Sulfurimonas sp.]
MTKIELQEAKFITPQLRKINRIKTLAGTLEIEGNFLGEEKITAILEGKKVLGTLREITEAEGAIEAYKEFERYDAINIKDLLRAHKILMREMLHGAGNFRTINVGVGGKNGVTHVAPPYERVPELMQELFGWLKRSDEHPLIKSSIFHYEFEFIHPFSDGNGRIGRLWQSVILYSWKSVFIAIPTESIVRDFQGQYYEALELSGAMGESTPFVEFMLEVILKSIENFIKSSAKSSAKSSVKTEDKILKIIKQNPTITIPQLAKRLQISSRAVEKQLAKLKEEQRLGRVGSNRNGEWKILDGKES